MLRNNKLKSFESVSILSGDGHMQSLGLEFIVMHDKFLFEKSALGKFWYYHHPSDVINIPDTNDTFRKCHHEPKCSSRKIYSKYKSVLQIKFSIYVLLTFTGICKKASPFKIAKPWCTNCRRFILLMKRKRRAELYSLGSLYHTLYLCRKFFSRSHVLRPHGLGGPNWLTLF